MPPSLAKSTKLILLVEDEALVAMAEGHVLKGAGYEVELAKSGEAAVAFVDGCRLPDLILMDIDLGPGIDGTEAAIRILSTHKVPIVFLTSHSSNEMVSRVRGITRYGYIIKNSGSFVLLSSIEMALELRAKERALEEKNLLLERAEEIAGLGYWYVSPGERRINLSPGSRAILGLEGESIAFEDFERQVLSEASAKRTQAFSALLSEGRPYDLTYRIKRGDNGLESAVKSSGRLCGGTVVGVIQDVSGIEALLGELRKSEERQAVTLRSIGDGVISTDRQGRVVELNRMAEALTGWTGADAVGRPIAEVFAIVNAMTRAVVENPIEKVLETGYIVGLANHTVLISRDGKERHIADSAAPIRDDKGSLLGVVLVFRDVTEDYLAAKQLERDAVLFKTLFNESHTPMLLLSPRSGSIYRANRAASRFYGWSVEELSAMNVSRINTLSEAEIAERMKQALAGGKSEFRFTHRLADGSERQVLVSSGPVRLDGEDLLLSIVNDATEASKLEEEMRSLRAKSEILVQDSRHRVKNSVQMIQSLIALRAGDEPEGEVLAELQNRVASMAIVYEHLYVEEGRELIGSRAYFTSFLKSMEESYFPEGVHLVAEIEEMVLYARFAISLGLVVGELVMNACKYAFPDKRAGTILVSLSRLPGSRLCMRIRDDGIGIEGSRSLRSGGPSSGMGLRIISNLVALEGGEMSVEEGGRGASILCTFPIDGRIDNCQ